MRWARGDGIHRCKPWLKEAHPALVPELFEEGELEAKYVAFAHLSCLPYQLRGYVQRACGYFICSAVCWWGLDRPHSLGGGACMGIRFAHTQAPPSSSMDCVWVLHIRGHCCVWRFCHSLTYMTACVVLRVCMFLLHRLAAMAVDAEAAAASASAAVDAAVASSLTGPKLVKRAGGRSTRVNPEILIHTDQRQGRKQVTIVMGLDLFDIKLADAARACKKTFASGATVAKVRSGGHRLRDGNRLVGGGREEALTYGPCSETGVRSGTGMGRGSGMANRRWNGVESWRAKGTEKEGRRRWRRGGCGGELSSCLFTVSCLPSQGTPVFRGSVLMPTGCRLFQSACTAPWRALGANVRVLLCPFVKLPPPALLVSCLPVLPSKSADNRDTVEIQGARAHEFAELVRKKYKVPSELIFIVEAKSKKRAFP